MPGAFFGQAAKIYGAKGMAGGDLSRAEIIIVIVYCQNIIIIIISFVIIIIIIIRSSSSSSRSSSSSIIIVIILLIISGEDIWQSKGMAGRDPSRAESHTSFT